MERSGPVTLRLVAAIAATLFRLRLLLLIVGIAAGVWFVLAVVDTEAVSTAALLPLTLVLWVGLALAVAYTLPRLPPAVMPGDGLIRRLRTRLQQAAYGFAVIAMLALSGFVLMLSWRTLGLVLS
jgi:hypothetical protein